MCRSSPTRSSCGRRCRSPRCAWASSPKHERVTELEEAREDSRRSGGGRRRRQRRGELRVVVRLVGRFVGVRSVRGAGVGGVRCAVVGHTRRSAGAESPVHSVTPSHGSTRPSPPPALQTCNFADMRAPPPPRAHRRRIAAARERSARASPAARSTRAARARTAFRAPGRGGGLVFQVEEGRRLEVAATV